LGDGCRKGFSDSQLAKIVGMHDTSTRLVLELQLSVEISQRLLEDHLEIRELLVQVGHGVTHGDVRVILKPGTRSTS
jgi:hypothetical protein